MVDRDVLRRLTALVRPELGNDRLSVHAFRAAIETGMVAELGSQPSDDAVASVAARIVSAARTFAALDTAEAVLETPAGEFGHH